MTLFSAKRIGLPWVGSMAEGQWADLTLVDPQTVADNTTHENPETLPTGIRAVLISGQVVAKDGQIVSRERRGRVLR